MLQSIKFHPFFRGLSEEEMVRLLEKCEQKTFRKQEWILQANEKRKGLILLLEGIAEVCLHSGSREEVLEVVQKGEWIGFSSLADFLGVAKERTVSEIVSVRAVEQTTVLIIPFSVILERWGEQHVHDYLLAQVAIRLQDVYYSLAEQLKQSSRFADPTSIVLRVQDVMSEDVVHLPTKATVQEVAQTMANKRISSVLMMNDGELEGIITETDLVTRVMQAGLPYHTLAQEVMTKQPISISRFAYYYDAFFTMVEQGIKHLPVVDGKNVVGIVTFSDLLRKKSENMLRTIQQIECANIETLSKIKEAIYELLGTMIRDDLPAAQTLRLITHLYDRLMLRCVALALQEVGPPPSRFAFYQMGSSARGEQFLLTDQDHFLIYEREEHGAYFAALGEKIVQMMETAGYARCMGNMMASEPSWRGTVMQWRDRLQEWIVHAVNENLLLAQNFFSYRFLYGDSSLHGEFEEMVKEQMKRAKIFLFRLAEVEKEHEIPTLDHPIRSMFRLERKTLDMKKEVLFPYHHSVQILSLLHGIVSGTPTERLAKLKEKRVLSESFFKDIQKAVEQLFKIYMKHKWKQYVENERPTSVISFIPMTTREKDELMLSLKTLKQLQQHLFSHF